MKSIAKLKDRARKHEQKEDWQAAIDAYQQVLEVEAAEDEVDLELGLYNRIGDLYLRLGETDKAVEFYETAADKYAESGFFNNAIALCNKALRHRPDRPETYLKLSHLCAEQGFIPDARRWIVDYAERQVKRGKMDAALSALGDFADESGDPDVRELLAQHLANQDRADDAIEQLRRARWTRLERGETEVGARLAARAAELDPAVDLTAEAAPAAAPRAPEPGGDFEGSVSDRPAGEGAETSSIVGLDGLETHRQEPAETGAASGIEGLEATIDEDALPGAGVEPTPDAGLELEPDSDEEAEPLPMLDTGLDDEADEEPEPLPLLDVPSAEEEPEPAEELAEEPAEEPAIAAEDTGAMEELEGLEDLEGLEGLGDVAAAEEDDAMEPLPSLDLDAGVDAGATERPAADAGAGADMALDFGAGFDLGDAESGPEEGSTDDLDVESVLTRAKELVSRGLAAEALRELRLLSGTHAPPDVFRQALSIATEVVRHDPDDVTALQRRVEFAVRTEDRQVLVDAYTDLADGLERVGAQVKSKAMYERALELDPGNEAARAALGEPEPSADETVDLDAILREMAPETAPVHAEQSSEPDDGFAAMLSSFKARVTDQPTPDDAGDHYDLGLAFKEMGLIDEAIGEFQTALTGGEERLKVYEELGQCFIQKGQFNVAIKILNRALQAPRQDDSDLLGVYYHLGYCHEEIGQRAEARDAYERVLDIHPQFADVPDRVARL